MRRQRVARDTEQHRRGERLFRNEQFIVGFEFGWCVRPVVVIWSFVVVIRVSFDASISVGTVASYRWSNGEGPALT